MKFETQRVLRPQPRRDVRRDARATTRPWPPRRGSPSGSSYYASLDLGKRHFPAFQPPGELDPRGLPRASSASRACSERYGDHPPQAALDRLEHELGIINRMGFASYFLIVWDFVRFARETGIPNSARGSACGALVSYLLYLSHVDPLKYDLLFERFLDPNRSEAPDIDIDLCQDRRYEVIEYVRSKYGDGQRGPDRHLRHDGRQGRAQDVGRALNIPLVAGRRRSPSSSRSSSTSRSRRRSRRSPS